MSQSCWHRGHIAADSHELDGSLLVPTKANIARRIGSGSEGQAAMILALNG